MPTAASQRTSRDEHDHEMSISVEVDQIADAVTGTITRAGKALTARGGLPLYLGLGVLAAADVIAWPVAAVAGLSYAVIRRWSPFQPSPALKRGPAGAKQVGAPRAARAGGTGRARTASTTARRRAPAARTA